LFSSYNKDQPPINHWINNACITSLPWDTDKWNILAWDPVSVILSVCPKNSGFCNLFKYLLELWIIYTYNVIFKLLNKLNPSEIATRTVCEVKFIIKLLKKINQHNLA
jgi:hypothetical protein